MLKRILNEYEINVCIKPHKTNKSILDKSEDSIDLNKKRRNLWNFLCGVPIVKFLDFNTDLKTL